MKNDYFSPSLGITNDKHRLPGHVPNKREK